MTRQLSPRHALVLLLSATALACGLSVSGLGEQGGATDAGTVGSGQSTGGGTVKPADAAASGTGGGGGADATASADAGVVLPPADDASASDDVHLLDPDASYEEAGDPCDLDEDGFRAHGECGGNDCCDFDSRANPGDTAYYPTPDACGSFDYDCNGKDDKEWDTAKCQLGFLQCSGDGFDKAPPDCGVAATFDACQFDVLFCGSGQSTQIEACR